MSTRRFIVVILLTVVPCMAVLTVEILNLFPFAVKAVFALPVETNTTSFVLFICPVSLFLVFIAIVKWNPHIHALISEGGAGNITPWRPVKHFDYNFLRNAFRKVLLEQLTSRIGPSFRKVKNEMYTRHEDNKTVTETIPALDFIQKLIVHIPEKHFKMLRYYGVYAKHHKQEKKLRKCISAKKQRFLRSIQDWQHSILLSFGYDPLCCSECGTSMLVLEVYHKKTALFEQY